MNFNDCESCRHGLNGPLHYSPNGLEWNTISFSRSLCSRSLRFDMRYAIKLDRHGFIQHAAASAQASSCKGRDHLQSIEAT